MKKVLFATTALIATAGMAAADVNFSGGARFGVVYDDSRLTNETRIHNRFTLNIDGTAETDSGLSLFARVRIRGGNTGPTGLGNSGVSAPRVGLTAGNLTVAVGNILGALESTPGLYDGNVGLTGLSWGSLPVNNSAAGAFQWDSFSSAGAGSNGIEVIYSVNGFGLHVSHSGTGATERTAAHVSYAFGDWTVALGHQDAAAVGADTTLLTVAGSFGPVNVGLAHADNEGDFDSTRINASFEAGAATTVTAYVSFNDGVGREDGYGLGFTHSLGGATLAGGIEKTRADSTRADLGIRFNF